ncbi:transposase domain-containing protein [[Clostridium] polysaccharolyticum]
MANNLKPLPYLEYVFEQIQLTKDLQTEDLLPWSEKIPECCKNQEPSSSQ